jgi:DNA-binding MarR family transcriptional regulator
MLRGVINDAIRSNYSRLNVIWTEGLIQSLTNLRATFGNDMDKIVVLAVIGQNAQRLVPPGRSFEETVDGIALSLPNNAATNVQSIADSTGIPRESVRRKVVELIEAGWVERLENGTVRISKDAVAKDLREITERQFVTIDRTVTAMVDELERMQIVKLLPVEGTSADGSPPGEDLAGSQD